MCISFHVRILLMTLFLIQIVYMNKNIVYFFMHNKYKTGSVAAQQAALVLTSSLSDYHNCYKSYKKISHDFEWRWHVYP